MINIEKIQQFTNMQLECLNFLLDLIRYDKEQSLNQNLKAENTRVLDAFIDTQKRALDMTNNLIEKHKESLTKIANAERAKIDEETKKKVQETKINVDKDKAKKDETSLFFDNTDIEGESNCEENC